MSLRQYGLDPAHYYTAPGLGSDAIFKKIEVELELLKIYDNHLFVEKGMRRGTSMVSKRYAKAKIFCPRATTQKSQVDIYSTWRRIISMARRLVSHTHRRLPVGRGL